MIGQSNSTFPTKFAIQAALTCDLFVSDDETHFKMDEYHDLKERLQNFQKLSFSLDFKTCIKTAYFNYKLSEEQCDCLQFIYENTALWLKGHVVDSLVQKLDSKFTTGKEAADLGHLLNDKFIEKNQTEEERKKPLNKSLLVKLANLPPGTNIPGLSNVGDD